MSGPRKTGVMFSSAEPGKPNMVVLTQIMWYYGFDKSAAVELSALKGA